MLCELWAAHLWSHTIAAHSSTALDSTAFARNVGLHCGMHVSAGALYTAGKASPPAKQQPKGLNGVAAGLVRPGVLWRLADILARPDEFCRVLRREVLSGKVVVMSAVVMLEAPVDAAHLQVRVTCWRFWQKPQKGAAICMHTCATRD